jgi:tetratricopeptide (TPR) repeat protein
MQGSKVNSFRPAVWRRRRCCYLTQLLLVGTAALAAANALAQDGFNRLLTEDARSAIEYPLPPVSEIIGVPVTRNDRPVVVVADLNDEGSDCPARALGAAIGAVMRVESWGLSEGLSVPHPVGYWADVTGSNDGLTPGMRVAHRTGANWLVTGTTRQADDLIDIDFRIVDTKTSKLRAEFRLSTRMAEMPDKLADAITTILSNFAGEARLKALRQRSALSFGSLANAMQRNLCEQHLYFDEIERAWNDAPDFPATAALYAYSAAELRPKETLQRWVKPVLAASDQHPVVQLQAANLQIAIAPQNHDEATIALLKTLAARYPFEPYAIDMLSEAIAMESVLFADPVEPHVPQRVISGPVPHYAPYAEALSLAFRAVEVWPDDYRSWWAMALALHQYSMLVRGTDFWERVPDSAKHRYPLLIEQEDHALDRAIRLHPGRSSLYDMKIGTDQEMGRDWMGTFRQGIELSPHDPELYTTAWDYSENQWGGSAAMRYDIYRLASKNNPDSDWPAHLYRRWAGSEALWPIYRWQIIAGAVLMAAGFGWFAWRTRRR